jgi:hypothetical protein
MSHGHYVAEYNTITNTQTKEGISSSSTIASGSARIRSVFVFFCVLALSNDFQPDDQALDEWVRYLHYELHHILQMYFVV